MFVVNSALLLPELYHMSTRGPNLVNVSANFCLVMDEFKFPTESLAITYFSEHY